MEFKQIQKLFAENVSTQKLHQELAALIVPGGTLSVDEAFSVYSMDYQARLQEALGTNFEATWLMMGDEDFLQYAQEYIASHPSGLSNLTNYGESFPDYLREKNVDEEVTMMSIFERVFWKLFHQEDSFPHELTQRVLEEATFDLSGLHLLRSQMRLELIWEFRQEGSDALEGLDLYQECYLVLFKAFEKVEVRSLSEDAFNLLSDLSQEKMITKLSPRSLTPEIWAEALDILRFSLIHP